ncbi:glucosaminidase domain-containing protein [Companilactobacillus jidongensis]|uniref:glucosaminidase domain-containing protein n=1 Tax=Companilactobacillus jidongensis TaxID=2486006 RepID=UPI000F79D822|nr:glucosaminidase domain-containing protein [Companilactobacillus jidongensis]
MNKKVLLTSVAVLNTVAAVAAPTVASAASITNQTTTQQTSDKTSDTNVIAGPEVKKADPTIAHSAVVQASSADPLQPTIVESSSNYVSPAQQQAFLAQAVPMAQQAAAKYNVYASVMLAQAIIESAWGSSDLATMGNNLFGMKGDYNGSSINLPTAEWSASQGYYYINAAFRKYPSLYESFADNGDKIRNGVAWDAKYYSGAWKENTSSYQDATAWLQGRYATEPTYAAILNNMIQIYNLTQYDNGQTSAPDVTPDNSNTDTNTDTNAETNGSSNDDSTTGTVTVNATPYARISDNNGKAIKNRALMTNTDWYFNKKSTHADGSVWYHVATNEWVNANDITQK